MARPIWIKNCTPAFIEMVTKFVTDKIAKRLAKLRTKFGMQAALSVPSEDYMDIDIDEDVAGNEIANEDVDQSRRIEYLWECFFIVEARNVVYNHFIVTERQLRTFLQLCLTKYLKAKIEPGTFIIFLQLLVLS